MTKSKTTKPKREKPKFEGWIPLSVLFILVVFGFFLLLNADNTEVDTRRYVIRCLDDNRLLYTFRKTKEDWWVTAYGTVMVKDEGKEYTFNKRSCTFKPIEEN